MTLEAAAAAAATLLGELLPGTPDASECCVIHPLPSLTNVPTHGRFERSTIPPGRESSSNPSSD